MDSDRSDRQQANSRKLQATHLMRGAALRMESCCAVTIRARAPAMTVPNQQGRLYACSLPRRQSASASATTSESMNDRMNPKLAKKGKSL